MGKQRRKKLKRRKDGRFLLRYDGQYFYSTPWAPNDDECYQQKAAYIKAKEAGATAVQNLTFGQYGAKWLPIHKAGCKPTTYNNYACVLDTIIKQIGGKKLRDITSDDLTGMYASMAGKSSSLISKAKNLTRSIFDSAVSVGLCEKNPARDDAVDIPKGTKGSHRAITDEERRLIHRTQHNFRPMVMLMLYSGVRPEEARMIDVQRDVDFEKKVINIRGAAPFDGNQPDLGDGKNEFAERSIILLPILEKELKGITGLVGPSKTTGKIMTQSSYDWAWESYKLAYEKELNEFPSGYRWWGRTREHKKMAQRAKELREHGMEEEAKKYDLPEWKRATFRPYDFRHSFCTMCRDAGVDIHVCMKWMGHSDEKMIMQIYDHVSDYREHLSAEMLKKIGFGSQNGSQIDTPPPESQENQGA